MSSRKPFSDGLDLTDKFDTCRIGIAQEHGRPVFIGHLRHDDEDTCTVCPGDQPFVAVDDEMVAVTLGIRLQHAGISASTR